MSVVNSTERYQGLVDVARSLGQVMDLDALLDEILRRSQEVMGAEATTIYLLDSATQELIINSARGDSAPMLFGARIPKGVGIAGTVYESRVTINIPDAYSDPRFNPEMDKKTGFHTRCLLTVPLMNGEHCLGVFQAVNAMGREHFDQSDEDICEAFSGLIVSALLRIEAQKRQMEEIKRQQEMSLATEVQQAFLPEPKLTFESCRVRMHYIPARNVGGDFYFVHPCPDNRFLVGLGDVSGKGIPAALNMASAAATIRALANLLSKDLGEWVTEVNVQLSKSLHAGRFIGMTFLLADPENGHIHIVAAGQYPPFRQRGQHWTHPDCPNQLPLGVLSGFQYKTTTHSLMPGDQWMLFSDGITEARNPEGEEFTEEQFLKSLIGGLTPSKTFDHAVQSWETFVNGAPQHDDASLMLLDWRGLKPPSRKEHTCCPTQLGCGRDFIETWVQYAGFDDITSGQIVLAVDEAVTNVYRYAYEGKPGPLTFEANIKDDSLEINLHDEGIPVDTSKIKGRALDDVRPGGLGTVLLGRIFDEYEYHPREAGTILHLSKKLPLD